MPNSIDEYISGLNVEIGFTQWRTQFKIVLAFINYYPSTVVTLSCLC